MRTTQKWITCRGTDSSSAANAQNMSEIKTERTKYITQSSN